MESSQPQKLWEVKQGITDAWLGDDGIIRYEYTPNANETLADAIAGTQAMKQHIPKGKKYPMLVFLNQLKSITAEARAYYAGPETTEYISASAALVNNPISSVIINFYLNVNKPPFPTRFFTSEDEAIAWLKTFVV